MTRSRVLILGWTGSTDLGDELIAESVCDLLRDVDCAPTVTTIDLAASARLGVPMVRHAGASDALGLARAIRRHDAVVFGGGGLLQDETGPFNLPFHLSRLATARLLRVPWAGVALGFGAVNRRSGRVLIRATMRNAVAISMRDHASADRLRSLTGSLPVTAADPVLAREVGSVEPSDHLVVSLRRANVPGQRRLQTSADVDEARLARWAEVIDTVAERNGVDVRFVAWERGQDHEIHEAVAARLRTTAVTEVPDAGSVLERMGAGRLVLSMRYHGTIAGLLHGRPTLALDYSPKMGDLVAESHGGLALAPLDASAIAITEGLESTVGADEQRAEALVALRARAARNHEVVAQLAAAARH